MHRILKVASFLVHNGVDENEKKSLIKSHSLEQCHLHSITSIGKN